ncbi:sorting nexin-25-like isoform X2 [Ornithodoros turicata]
MYLGMVSVGLFLGCKSVLCTDEKYTPVLKKHPGNKMLQQVFEEKLKEYNRVINPVPARHPPIVFSRAIDAKLNEIIDLVTRDFVIPWYQTLVPDHRYFCALLRDEIWRVLWKIKDRCHKMDDVKFFTEDVVKKIHVHFQKVRLAGSGNGEKQPYELSSFLRTKDSEQDHVRKMTEFLLAILLPSEYALCISVRHLLREIFTCLVFYPMVTMITDPKYINEKMLAYLKWLQSENEKHSRTYAYAETWEDFVFMIETCTDVDNLKRMRFNIIAEIMQATTQNNLKKAKGISEDKEYEPQSTAKGDLLQSRNLTKYIKQLTYAKTMCEKRLKLIGGMDFSSPTEEQDSLPGKKVFAFSVIMESPQCREYLAKFLRGEEGGRSLFAFWRDVEEMRTSSKDEWHQLGNVIYQTYIKNPRMGIKLSRTILKGIEAFIMADSGPEAFFQAQQEIYKILEERYYPSFLLSEAYHNLVLETKKSCIDVGRVRDDDERDPLSERTEDTVIAPDQPYKTVTESCIQAKSQLRQLEAKLDEKKKALHALHATLNSDPKMVQVLEKEMSEMRATKNQLERHIERAQMWAENIGKWKATVHSSQIVKDANLKPLPYFAIMVESSGAHQTGWVVTKTLADFHHLQQKLLPVAPNLKKKIVLPPSTKPRFRSYDQVFLDKTEPVLQQFLSYVMEEDALRQSEALYTFFNQGPDALIHDVPVVKKASSISLFQRFKNFSVPLLTDSSDDDSVLFLNDRDLKEDRKDDIAVPLYAMAGEVFELQGVFNWLRRTLIAFVQTSYGKTINKQLREWVAWIVSEPMLIYYLDTFRDSMWPDGQTPGQASGQADTEKCLEEDTARKHEAKMLLLNNIPEVLNLVGQQNARKGVAKAFDILQDVRLNKQLFYDIFEAFLYEFAPELTPC